MAKGTVYSGIVYFPDHPDADLHGLIRIAIRAQSWLIVQDKLGEAEIPLIGLRWKIWQESKSHTEHQATERRHGELLACPLVLQYLKPENYKPIPKSLLRRKIS